MSKKCLIHVGLSKTGTTSIQHYLTATIRNNRSFPVRYPTALPIAGLCGRENHNFLKYCLTLPDKHDKHLSKLYSASELAEHCGYYLEKFYKESEIDSIISAESLSNSTLHEANKLKDMLKSVGFIEFLVLIYVRNPCEYYSSGVQQSLRHPCTYVNPVIPSRFQTKIETWQTVFGVLNVRVKSYNAASCITQDARQEFIDFFDKPFPDIPMNFPNHNQSLTREGLEILHNYNMQHEDGIKSPESNELRRCIFEHPIGQKLQLTDDTKSLISYVAQPDLDWLYHNFGIQIEMPAPSDQHLERFRALPVRLTDLSEIYEPPDPALLKQAQEQVSFFFTN